MISKNALVLTGGGARGAYQAGVLKAYVEMLDEAGLPVPFSILTGISAGSLNAAGLTSGIDDPLHAVLRLAEFWAELKTSHVYRTDYPSLIANAFRWGWDLFFGGLHHNTAILSLVDTTPLRELIVRRLDFGDLHANLAAGRLEALALTSVDYESCDCVTFIESTAPHVAWTRVRRRSMEVKIEVDHLMASAALPVVFPPVWIGNHYYGDGGLRNHSPLSPAIRLGADRILVVGVHHRPALHPRPPDAPVLRPTIARLASIAFNSIFLDAVEMDLERLQTRNELIRAHRCPRTPEEDTSKSADKALAKSGNQPAASSPQVQASVPASVHARDSLDPVYLRTVEYLYVTPSRDPALIALEHLNLLPRPIRYLVQGLGSESEGAEFVSYLLFEPPYLKALIALGEEDARAQKAEILEVLSIAPEARHVI